MTTVIPALISIVRRFSFQHQTMIRLDQQPGKASNATEGGGYQNGRCLAVALCHQGC